MGQPASHLGDPRVISGDGNSVRNDSAIWLAAARDELCAIGRGQHYGCPAANRYLGVERDLLPPLHELGGNYRDYPGPHRNLPLAGWPSEDSGVIVPFKELKRDWELTQSLYCFKNKIQQRRRWLAGGQ